MAGKHVGGDIPFIGPGSGTGAPNLTSHHFSPKLDKAYAEGRGGSPPVGEAIGSPLRTVWASGFTSQGTAAEQYETATVS